MKLRGLFVRRFRSIERAELTNCAGLNVLIGKNNSGKSNLLSTIALAHSHLQRGNVASVWSTDRPQDEFWDRSTTEPLQIGLEYRLEADVNAQLRTALQTEAPHLERSIEQLKDLDRLSIIVAAAHHPTGAFLFVQSVTVGSILSDQENLRTDGINLLAVPVAVGTQLAAFQREIADLRTEEEQIRSLLNNPNRLEYLQSARDTSRMYFGEEWRQSLIREVGRLAAGSSSRDDLTNRLTGALGERRSKIDALESRETEGAMTTFAGAGKLTPGYANWLLKRCGSQKVLNLKETRDAVGRDEAEALLTLKVTRGGPEQLATIQRTVKTLLGVSVDAFQGENTRSASARSRAAEIDIDRFLIDANGAGVREALRLVLDFELKEPNLVLIEEPEVHLHPGLEHAVYQYLRDKSRTVQIFVTTHSTNFVDSISFQNTYLVSKDGKSRTTCRPVSTDQAALQVPAELGLRLSTVFMYDRLVFVEGPSDEAVLRELCKTLEFDLPSANVGFVQMGGVRNFAHFAAEGTLDLLSRRQIRMWFVADRDERDDKDVAAMMSRLGNNSTLKVLEKRELENYLLDADAIRSLVALKRRAAGLTMSLPTTDEVERAIERAATGLKDEVIRLRLNASTLAPVHFYGKQMEGSIEERLDRAIAQLEERRTKLGAARETTIADIESDWNSRAAARAPGTQILERVLQEFGVTFNKGSGDSTRLASLMADESITTEIRNLLREITRS